MTNPTGYVIIDTAKGESPRQVSIGRKEKGMQEEMTRLELLTVLLSLKALLESGNTEKAKELIDEVISEAKRKDQ